MKKNKLFDFQDAFCSFQHLQNIVPLQAIIYPQNPELIRIDALQLEKQTLLGTLSNKKLRPQLQISFQKNFMKEHTSVFCKSYEKFKEFQGNSSELFSKKSALAQIQTRLDLQHPTIVQILEENQSYLTVQQKKQFKRDLQYEEKLADFLDVVIKNVDAKDSLILILIAYEVWVQYTNNHLDEDSCQDLLNFGNAIVQTLIMPKFKDSLSRNLWTSNKEQIIKAFLSKYCITIILTIAEYFENPFYSEQSQKGKKRILEKEESSLQVDDDNFFIRIPSKKRKSSI